jgi:hypothetical protein
VDDLTDVLCTILFFVTGDVLDYITFAESKLVGMDVDNRLDGL